MLFAVGGLDVGVIQHLLGALAPLGDILFTQGVPLVKFFLCQLALLCKAGKLVYSLDLCVFHQSMLPNSSSVFSNAGIKCSIKYSTSGML